MDIKSENGITGIDLTIAIIVVMLFVSLITTLYLNIYNSSITTKRKTTANTYMETVFNEIKKADFSTVSTKQEVIDNGKDELLEYLKSNIKDKNITFYRTGDMPEDEPYKIEINVEKYNETEGNEWKKDLIRTVYITIHYRIGKREEQISSKIVKTDVVPVADSLGIKPDIKKGMIPVKYVVTNEETNDGYWQATNVGDPEWFDYSKRQWANVTFSDNLEMDEHGKISKVGSMFVYIPRYAYKITILENITSQINGGNMDIKFINEKNNPLTGGEINTQSILGYRVHPAFDKGDVKLNGIWVAKFESSNLNCTDDKSTGEIEYSNLLSSGTNKLQCKPGVTSWRNIHLDNATNVCKNMLESNFEFYGLEDNNEIESHLIENNEWGAVAYLNESIYGKGDRTIANKSDSFITGTSGKSITYTSPEGVVSSTTGNVYGIYDMVGGAYDMISGYMWEYDKDNNPGDGIGEIIGIGDIRDWFESIIFPSGVTNTIVRGGYIQSWNPRIYSFNSVTPDASVNKSFRPVVTIR